MNPPWSTTATKWPSLRLSIGISYRSSQKSLFDFWSTPMHHRSNRGRSTDGHRRDATPTGWQRLLVEPRRPESVRNRENAYWLAVAAVCIGAFMGQLDASIVTVALPTLQRTFHASVGAVTWVGLSYLLVLVATVTAVGRFADMWGRKLLYVYGFAIFVSARPSVASPRASAPSSRSGSSRQSVPPCSRPTASPSS